MQTQCYELMQRKRKAVVHLGKQSSYTSFHLFFTFHGCLLPVPGHGLQTFLGDETLK
jgi:hypothetical protein